MYRPGESGGDSESTPTRNNYYVQEGGLDLAEKMFIRVNEVAEALDVSTPYAYKLIRKLNVELEKKGCIVIAGRIDRRFFYEKFYSSQTEK